MTTGRGTGSPPAPSFRDAASLPGCLGELSHPPAGLWCTGDVGLLGGAPDRLVAIVGTREASAYGVRTATRLAESCVRAGLVVVSGLARGVDAAAHEAALRAGGKTIAVLGTGVDVPYPVGHRSLLHAISRHGLALSEVEPGTRAAPGCFPRRNRIIAALSKVTVVVEAGFKSGAINTASHALELGRTVAAVPGPIDDPRSSGANGLIRDGAQVICSVDELLSLFSLSTEERRAGARSEGNGKGSGEGASVARPRDPWAPIEGSGEGGGGGEVWFDTASLRQASLWMLARELGDQDVDPGIPGRRRTQG